MHHTTLQTSKMEELVSLLLCAQEYECCATHRIVISLTGYRHYAGSFFAKDYNAGGSAIVKELTLEVAINIKEHLLLKSNILTS